jgi:hypothetical protein
MSAPERLGRRLFEASRHERPNAELQARVLASCRTELARAKRPGWNRGVYPVAAVLALAAAFAFLIGSRRGEEALEIAPESVAQSASPPASTALPPALQSAPPASASAQRRAPSPTPSAARRPLTLPEEVALLDRVRAELRSGNPARALATLDEYMRSARAQRLGAEATLLRIEALSRSGRTNQASELARRFVENHPESPLADRARSFANNPPD